MNKIKSLLSALVVFVLFSALGYVIMTGGMAKYGDHPKALALDAFFSPLVNLFGPGITGATFIIIGSIIAGFALFGNSAESND